MLNTMLLKLALTVLSVLFPYVANSSPIPTGSTQLDPVRTVYQFPNATYVKNLAVRSNGQILVSLLTTPQLFLVNPVQIGEPILVHNFSGAISVAGIAEYEPDLFAVITGNFSVSTLHVDPGSCAVWSVDLRGVKSQSDNTLYPPPQVYKITDVPEAKFLNGISLLSQERGTLLVGDFGAGNILRLDIKSGAYKVVIASNLTAASTYPHHAGVDGLHVRDGYLFFANFGKYVFVKIPIDEDGIPTGNESVIARTLAPEDQFDDFTFDCQGNAYVVTGGGNSVERISPDGHRQVIIAGSLNSTAISEPTSAAFGRGPSDKNVLYVTTAGGLLGSLLGVLAGNEVVGGQLVAITTDAEGP